MTAPVQTQRRNRTETEARILAAARRIIAREGFRGLGIVAVANEAGCDKKLVTRYFGDLEGLIAALGGELGLWLGAAEAATPEGSYADRLAVLLDAYAASLRADPVLQQALAWELVAPSPAMQGLDAARSRAVGAWMAAARGDARPPEGVDAPAVNAVLLAALHYLTLREASLGGFAGLALDEAGRRRVQDAMRFLLRRAFGEDSAP
jgi:AcrR family transcriptional regulator